MVLVDSSVWIALLRENDNAQVKALRGLLGVDQAALAPPILQEILQGASSAAHFNRLREYFSTQPLLVSMRPIGSHEAAAKLYARCRWSGVTPRNGYDCLIAQTAIEHEVDLLADDRDYVAMARIEPRLRLYAH